MLHDRALVLDGDRIAETLPASEAPLGARTIDLSERTVLPGLIDCHAHLIGEMDEGQGYAYLVNRSSAQEALTGVTNALATLRGGVTTVRDVGTFHAFVDLALRRAVLKEEDVTERVPAPEHGNVQLVADREELGPELADLVERTLEVPLLDLVGRRPGSDTRGTS